MSTQLLAGYTAYVTPVAIAADRSPIGALLPTTTNSAITVCDPTITVTYWTIYP
jgi:hypothetical protein